jgi:hypothetical protein
MNEYERAILAGPNGAAELEEIRRQQRATRMQLEANQQQPTHGLQSVLDELAQQKPPTMIEAFGTVVEALQPLHDEAKLRVLRAAGALLGIDLVARGKGDYF